MANDLNLKPQSIMDILESMNNLRRSHQLHDYKYFAYGCELAQQHSSNMATHVVPFSHDGISYRIEAIRKKCGKDFIKASENVAFSNPDMNPVDAWIKSAGHLKNMLGDYNYCGIGKVQKGREFYYTAIFLKLKE